MRRRQKTLDEVAGMARLREIRLDVEAYTGRIDALYAERLALFFELRALGVMHKELGAASGVTDVAVVQALRKARAKAS